MINRLNEAELASALEALPGWTFDAGRAALYRRLKFSDFSEAMAFMVRVGIAAEKADHHPEWSNVYNTVDVWLTTHDADGVSRRDVALAQVIDQIAP